MQSWYCLVGLVFALIRIGAGATTLNEPLNLSTAKADIVRYVDSGSYARAIAAVGADTQAWLEARAARRQPNERLALVLDVDETALSNYDHMKSLDFGDVPGRWDQWVAEARAPALAPVREIFRTARKLGVAVFFLTGRTADQRGATARNLRAAGYAGYRQLCCKPAGDHRSTSAFKLEERRRLEAEGWTIIANVGDQNGDLTGGVAKRAFKLPDPFYLIE